MDSFPLAWLDDVALHHDAVVLENDLSGDVRVVLVEALLGGDGGGSERERQAGEDERDSAHWKPPIDANL
jgi:hypothetical protein